jgi:hypothetical protein
MACRWHLEGLRAVYGIKDLEMSFKPNLDQLTVIADLSLARMPPDFIATASEYPLKRSGHGFCCGVDRFPGQKINYLQK